eukprot:tig00001215_g7581.t1
MAQAGKVEPAGILLPHRVERRLEREMQDQARKECDDFLKAYAECARGRTVSVAWTCRTQASDMSACLKPRMTDAILAERRAQFIKEHPEILDKAKPK